jgi:hypothetical protein
MSPPEVLELLGGNMGIQQMERGLDDQLNKQFANETSRTVKICMLKHKCILMFSFMLISLLQFVYIVFKEVMGDAAIKESFLQIASLYTRSTNVTVNR